MRKECHISRPKSGKGFLGSSFALLLTLLPHSLFAAPASLLLIYDNDKAHTQQFIQAFSAAISAGRPPPALQLINLRETGPEKLAGLIDATTTLVTLGSTPSDRVAEQFPDVPLLACLSSLDGYRKTSHLQYHPHHAVRLIDQPLERMFRLVTETLGYLVDRIGLVVGEAHRHQLTEVERVARQQGVEVESRVITDQFPLSKGLDAVAAKTQTLLLLPDPEILNRTTAKTLFMNAYLNRTAVFGYSPSTAKAGALASLFSTPVQLGTECAQHALTMDTLHQDGSNRLYYPTSFSVAINYRIAKTLSLDVPDEEQLLNTMTNENRTR